MALCLFKKKKTNRRNEYFYIYSREHNNSIYKQLIESWCQHHYVVDVNVISAYVAKWYGVMKFNVDIYIVCTEVH